MPTAYPDHRSSLGDGRANGAEPGPWLQRAGPSEPAGATASLVSVELKLRVTGMAELNRALGARVFGGLFGPGPR